MVPGCIVTPLMPLLLDLPPTSKEAMNSPLSVTLSMKILVAQAIPIT